MFGKMFFFLCAFGLIFGTESENIKRDDVKDEPKEATMLLEKPAERKIYYSLYDWLFSTNSSPSAEAKDLEKMKEEMGKENDFLTELEEAPRTGVVGQEINPETLSDMPKKTTIGKLEESASAKGSCCWKVKVSYSTKNDAYTQQSHIFGYYRKESTYINGKPHYTSMFSSGSRAIWFDDNTNWVIGLSRLRGTTRGYAYNSNNYNCPYDPAYDWKYWNRYSNWANAGEGLSIWNQC